MYELRTGNRLSCTSSAAVELYQQGIDLILGSESGADRILDQALDLDENFAMAAAARYFVAQDAGEPGGETFRHRAQKTAVDATDWEREHIEVLIGLLDEPMATQAKAEAYIETSPADLLVISQLTGNIFFYGGPTKLESFLNVFESVESALADDWAFLARLGFACSEAGQRERGRALFERALAIRPQSLYTIHGLAHLLHDDGAAEESASLLNDWLLQYESGAREGQMYGHVQWHLALAEWQIGEQEAAQQRYRSYCAPETTTCGPILTLADCGGFLLRDYLKSGHTRVLSDRVREHIEKVWGMLGHPFITLHVAGLFASAGDQTGLQRCKEAISATPSGPNRDTSLTLVAALSEYVAGDFQHSAHTLASLSKGARIGIGGSNVERILVDLIEQGAKARQ